MNSHRRYRELLARRVELTPADERRLREHLEGCPECRATAAAYEHQWQLLRSLPPLQTPPTLRASVLHRIHQAPPSVPWYRRRMNLFAPLLAAAVLALVVVASVAGSQVLRQHGNGNALSSQAPTHPPKRPGATHPTYGSPFPSSIHATVRPGPTKSAGTGRPPEHDSGALSRVPSPGTQATPPVAPPRLAPTPRPDTGRFVATPVRFAPGNAVAAVASAVPHTPPVHRPSGSAPSAKAAPIRKRPAGATAQPHATAAPTSGPVRLADGPPPTPVSASKPPSYAPIQSAPAPAPTVPPVVAITPAPVDAPMPIIPSTPTPTPTPTARP